MRDSKIVNEIPPHSIHGLRIKGYDVIGVNVFHFTLMNQNTDNSVRPILLAGTTSNF